MNTIPDSPPPTRAVAALAAPDAGKHRARAQRALTLALLAAATAAAFWGSLRNGRILLDDPLYVFNNPHVNRGWTVDGLLWFLHEPHGGNWHPLTSYSHMLDVQLFGPNPAGHHATSLALHVLNALLVVVVLHRLTGAWWRSAIVAGLFALHPLRVESVAWISERKDVLSTVFFLLTIAAYQRWVERPGAGRYALVVLGLVLGLMAKPMLVSLPFLLVLLDVWPLRRLELRAPAGQRPAVRGRGRSLAGLIGEKWPLFALAVISSVVTFLVQRKTGAVVSVVTVSFTRRICNALITCWRYIGLTLWPHDLAIFYPFNRAADVSGALAAATGLVAATALALWQLRRRPYLAVGWLWYLGTLVPVIGLVQVGGQAFADRYTYIPVLGFLIVLVWGVNELVSRSRLATFAAAGVAVAAMAALGWATTRQVALWRDTRTLFTHTLAVTRDNAPAQQSLGNALLEAGQIEPAIAHLREALRLVPDFPEAHNNLGSALGALGRYGEAIEQFQAALRKQNTAELHHNLGFVYLQQGRLDDAIHEFQAALRLDPDLLGTQAKLGQALGARGRLDEAVPHLRRALESQPGDIGTRRSLAVSLTLQGKVEEAIAEYDTILRQAPDDLDALNNVAWIRATHAEAAHRDGVEAVRLAERARDRSPQPVAVLYSTLAAAYAEAGRFAEAVKAGQQAVALAKAAKEAEDAERFAQQLARYRAGRPFHFSK